MGRRSALHVSEGCVALFNVAYAYQEHSVYRNRINEVILRITEAGLFSKLLDDVNYDAKKRATGRQQPIGIAFNKVKLASPDERGLTLADTEGMFILLGIGFIIALGALISEWVGGCTNKVMRIMKKRKHDQDEAERVEREREQLEEHPSRRDSRTSKLSTPHSIHSVSALSKDTLKELYDGPESQKSTICMYNGSLMTEEEVYAAQRHIQKGKESLPSTAGSTRKRVVTTVEVNHEGALSEHFIEKGIFGGEVLY